MEREFRAIAQTFTHRLAVHSRVQCTLQSNAYGICGRQNVSEAGFSPTTSLFPCQSSSHSVNLSSP